jgi:hypothetical protein
MSGHVVGARLELRQHPHPTFSGGTTGYTGCPNAGLRDVEIVASWR